MLKFIKIDIMKFVSFFNNFDICWITTKKGDKIPRFKQSETRIINGSKEGRRFLKTIVMTSWLTSTIVDI